MILCQLYAFLRFLEFFRSSHFYKSYVGPTSMSHLRSSRSCLDTTLLLESHSSPWDSTWHNVWSLLTCASEGRHLYVIALEFTLTLEVLMPFLLNKVNIPWVIFSYVAFSCFSDTRCFVTLRLFVWHILALWTSRSKL